MLSILSVNLFGSTNSLCVHPFLDISSRPGEGSINSHECFSCERRSGCVPPMTAQQHSEWMSECAVYWLELLFQDCPTLLQHMVSLRHIFRKMNLAILTANANYSYFTQNCIIQISHRTHLLSNPHLRHQHGTHTYTTSQRLHSLTDTHMI